ncbi:hypothetical protein PVAP13_9KG152085 [Panicum virgatum]|uniref:Mitochondrial import inner membrane translocase subunit TIM50 n=1 Tax=Panicum virgatum TaxID=38727 RepID=A0A8T0NM63_PANVG|nr:hypothetical protein PVAP13_9KG152085 [Panicum virgatum]
MADGRAEGKLVFRRPYSDEFLDFCAQNFEVAIWSSRNKNNVELVVDIVMKDFKPCLLFCWGDYSPSNTFLVDDSPYKALHNPPHTGIFPHSYSYQNWTDDSVGPGGDLRVYLQKLADADDVQTYVRNNPFGQPFITDSDPHWDFYSQLVV